jgi:hypothetical protein
MTDLRVVKDDDGAPLPYDKGNALFQENWFGARKAYSDLLSDLGLIAHPLFIKAGPVSRARVTSAIYNAERIAKNAAEMAARLVVAREAFDRHAEYARNQEGKP